MVGGDVAVDVLDLATGSGDVAFELADSLPGTTRITGMADIAADTGAYTGIYSSGGGTVTYGNPAGDILVIKAGEVHIDAVEFRQEGQGRRALVVGLPGAFSPVCTRLHLPALVQSAAVRRGRKWVILPWRWHGDPLRSPGRSGERSRAGRKVLPCRWHRTHPVQIPAPDPS